MAEQGKTSADSVACFGSYRLELGSAQLWRGTQAVKLTGKAFAVLHYFVDHPGQLVSKDDLFQAVWPQTVVTESTLASCIQELRQALKDKAKTPRYIETVHRRGYRFLASLRFSPPVLSGQLAVFSSDKAEKKSPQLATGHWPLTTHLVGRDVELAQLHQWLAKALSGERQVVFVTGEAGIGKTALVDTFLQSLASSVQSLASSEQQERQKSKLKRQKAKIETAPRSLLPDPWISWGQCIEHYGAGEPYLPLLEALGRLCRAPEGKGLIDLLAQQAPTWLAQMPALLNATELEGLQRKTAGATKERMLRELAEALEVLTAERPLVLWLEDLHWSDPSTLDWLACVARRRERARLLLLGSYRPVETIVREHPLRAVKQELQLHGQCAELALGLLSEEAVGEYLAQRFASPSPAAAGEGRGEGLLAVPLRSLARTIHQRTDGNPLFLVAMVDDLVNRGVVAPTDEGWTLPDEGDALGIPESIRQLVTRQRERLRPEEQHLLEAASVAGMEFSAASVAAALATDTARVERRCEQLAERQQFLRRVGVEAWPDGTLAARYGFLHALYQQLWHERVSPTQLQHHHLRIGQRKEQAYGERVREIAAELAIHFEQGREYWKAIHYQGTAAQGVLLRNAPQEALSHLSTGMQLLEVLPDTPARCAQGVQLRMLLGLAFMTTKGYAAPEVESTYARAYELCQQLDETPQLCPVLLGLVLFSMVRGRLPSARALAEQCLGIAERARDPVLLSAAHQMMGSVLFQQGEFPPARNHLECALASYDPRRHQVYLLLYGHDPGVFGSFYLAWVLWHLGYPEQAISKTEDALALVRQLGSPYILSAALNMTITVRESCRETAVIPILLQENRQLCREHGFRLQGTLATLHQAQMHIYEGRVEEGIQLMRRALETIEIMGGSLQVPYHLGLLAEMYGKAEQAKEGLEVVAEAIATVERTEERWWEAELYRLKGELLLQSKVESERGKRKVEREKRKVKSGKRKVKKQKIPTPNP
jgi:DNA-binding winged helix-turn-helix (wHTH) protein/predicted ATPase